jgi:hypothetical protein
MGSDLPISKVMKDESTRGPTSERAAGFLRRRFGAGVASAQPPVSTELIDINELSRPTQRWQGNPLQLGIFASHSVREGRSLRAFRLRAGLGNSPPIPYNRHIGKR